MATVKLGPTIAGIRGTVAGMVFSANKSGTYVKQWARGVDPKAAKQYPPRGYLAQFAYEWQSLSSAQRTGWDALAAAPPETDTNSLGDTVLLSGFQWFIRVNVRRRNVGLAISADAPAAVGVTAPTLVGVTVLAPLDNGGGAVVFYVNGDFPAGTYLILEAALRTSPGVAAPTTGYRIVWTAAAGAATATLFTSQLLACFGDVQPGWAVHIRMRKQSTAGFRSTTVAGSTVIAPA